MKYIVMIRDTRHNETDEVHLTADSLVEAAFMAGLETALNDTSYAAKNNRIVSIERITEVRNEVWQA